MKYQLLHRNGCGQVAFLYDHIPAFGELMQANLARMPNGDPMPAGERVVCGSCGMPMADVHVEDFIPTHVGT